MHVSNKGLDFIARHEGFVSKTYLDPVGIPTIGYGFTNGSTSVRRHLGKITQGMRISKEDAKKVLRTVVNDEYGRAANESLPNASQHHHDMGCSGSFNVGTRIFKWKWAQAFRRGDLKGAARLWRTTATTAKGKRLPGLVRRRQEEANLLLRGDYGRGSMPTFEPSGEVVPATVDSTLQGYQEKLLKLGYSEAGEADGLRGPKTTAAVKHFQRDNGLVEDGILGRATMQTIDRLLTEKDSQREGVGGGLLGLVSMLMTWLTDLPPYVGYAFGGLALAVAIYLLWKYRARFENMIMSRLG